MTDNWVVVTHYTGPKTTIVHAYGPYTVKSQALTERRKMLAETFDPELLKVSVCKLWRETN